MAGTLPGGVFKSTDGGASWVASNGGLTNKIVNALLLTDGNAAAVYAGTSAGNDVFVAKLNPAGSALTYSTFLTFTAPCARRSRRCSALTYSTFLGGSSVEDGLRCTD